MMMPTTHINNVNGAARITNTTTTTTTTTSTENWNTITTSAKTPRYLQPPTAIPPRTSSSRRSSASISLPPAKPTIRPVVSELDGLIRGSHPTRRTTPSSLPPSSPPPVTQYRRTTPSSPPSSSPAPSISQYFRRRNKMVTPPPPPPPPPPASSPGGFHDPARYATEDFDYVARQTWDQRKEDAVRAPYDYLLNHPGKDIRTSLINAFNVWLDVPREALDVIASVVAMLHTSSLLVDDVEDGSLLRRGVPVAHSIFGTARTINSANYIYFCALRELQRLRSGRDGEAVQIFSEELANLHRGQGMDLHWRDALVCPTEEEYLEMVGNKTGGLFRLAIKLMQAESSFSPSRREGQGPGQPSVVDCVPLVNLLGIIFQIQDDYRNLSSPEYGENKGFCEDLTEGKFSFLVAHSIRTNPRDSQLLSILKQKTNDPEVKRYAVRCIENTGSFEYTRRVLGILIERARKTADALGDGDPRKSAGIHRILDKLAVV